MGDRRYVYSLLVGRPEGIKPFGRSWHRWEDNSKMDLQKVGWGGMDWTDLVQDRQVAGTCEGGNEQAGITN